MSSCVLPAIAHPPSPTTISALASSPSTRSSSTSYMPSGTIAQTFFYNMRSVTCLCSYFLYHTMTPACAIRTKFFCGRVLMFIEKIFQVAFHAMRYNFLDASEVINCNREFCDANLVQSQFEWVFQPVYDGLSSAGEFVSHHTVLFPLLL